MNIKVLAPTLLALAISSNAYSEYLIKLPLGDIAHIEFDKPNIIGSSYLEPSTINRGQSSVIHWSYNYADEINIEGVGTFKGKSGSTTVTPTQSSQYKLLVTYGNKNKSEQLNITVNQPEQTIAFSADTYRIGVGTNALLSWTVSNAKIVSIDNGVGNTLSLTGSQSVSPATTTKYTLNATGFEGISNKSSYVDIVVVPNALINSFITDKTTVTKGDSTNFSWSVTNAESLTFNGEIIAVGNTTKSVMFNTVGTIPNKLVGTSLSGVKVEETVNVTVIEPVALTTVNAPTQVFANEPFTMSWVGTGATKYTLKSDNANSGIPTSEVDLNTTTSKTINPLAGGVYNYTLTASNSLGSTTSLQKSVTAESAPQIGYFTVGGTAIIPSLNMLTATVNAGAVVPIVNTSLLSTSKSYINNVESTTFKASPNNGSTSYNYRISSTLNGITKDSNTVNFTAVVTNGIDCRFSLNDPNYIWTTTVGKPGVGIYWAGDNFYLSQTSTIKTYTYQGYVYTPGQTSTYAGLLYVCRKPV